MDSPTHVPLPELSFVPTPIGNLADITLRALETLKTADIIACEDTRHSIRLLKHYNINKPLLALHDHNESKIVPEIIQKIQTGKRLAVISDAGTPLISDPGYRLLQACIKKGIDYTVLPGACSVITALAGSGFPIHAFSYWGFLPIKKTKRLAIIKQACREAKTAVFFESPHRILSTLDIIVELKPDLELCIARELTKKFESYHRNTASKLRDLFLKKPPKGEVVLLINPHIEKNQTQGNA